MSEITALPTFEKRLDGALPQAQAQADTAASHGGAEDVSRARAVKQSLQGMTLIEIMIVVVIMALIATGVGIAVIPQLQKAKVQDTQAGVEAVRSAVSLYIATNNAECATMDQLIEDKVIDKSKSTTDSWDHPFRIECDGTEINVTSAGPDGQFDTEDDIK
jgi:general secretion pathway protein G